MRKLFILITLFISFDATAQKIVEFRFIPASDADLEVPRIELLSSGDLEEGQSYKINLDNINTAFYEVKITPVLADLKSTTPEILKPVLIGIPDNSTLNVYKTQMTTPADLPSGLKKLFEEAKAESGKLQRLASATNSLKEFILENKNDTEACRKEAKQVLSGLAVEFAAGEEETGKKLLKEAVKRSYTSFLAGRESWNLLLKSAQFTFHGPESILKATQEFNQNGYFIEENKQEFEEMVELIFATIQAKSFVKTKAFTNDKDLTKVNIIVVSKIQRDTLLNYHEELYTEGGWKFDFTTGFFYNSVYSYDYYLNTENSDTRSIQRENSPEFDLAIGALAHASYRFKSYVKAGPCLGVAVSPLDGKSRYLGGLSLIYGRKKQLALDFGTALGKVKALSGKVSADGENALNPIPQEVTAVPTYEKFKWGFFLGLSYNLTAK